MLQPKQRFQKKCVVPQCQKPLFKACSQKAHLSLVHGIHTTQPKGHNLVQHQSAEVSTASIKSNEPKGMLPGHALWLIIMHWQCS